jgi:adenylate cyclase class 2
MLEVEVKFPVSDWSRLHDQLATLAAQPRGSHEEIDTYFNALPPGRDFAQTDEALRIRRVNADAWLTYKGPKLDAATKTRLEVEVPLGNGHRAPTDLARVLELLGYRPVAVVRKTRQTLTLTYGGWTVNVCLDEVAEVGRFVELEVVATPEQLDAARAAVLELAGRLGLTQPERRSYLQLLLQRGEQG